MNLLILSVLSQISTAATTSSYLRDVGCLKQIDPPYSSGELRFPMQDQVYINIEWEETNKANLVFTFANKYEIGNLDAATPMVQTYPGGYVRVWPVTETVGCGAVTLFNFSEPLTCSSNAKFSTICFEKAQGVLYGTPGTTWSSDMVYEVSVPANSLLLKKTFHATYTLLTPATAETTLTVPVPKSTTVKAPGDLSSGGS
ncbi:hypothetical protein BDR26DRAFT_865233, partial [Obelidium mucronatum]